MTTAETIVRAAEACAFAVTCVAAVVVLYASTTNRPRLEHLKRLADRWLLQLLAGGVVVSLAGHVIFGSDDRFGDLVVRGMAFGVVAWTVQALVAGREAHGDHSRLKVPAVLMCLVPLVLAALGGAGA